jgi:hypothetical protein
MSDERFTPAMPGLMSAVRARDLARRYKGFADLIRADDPGGARHADQQSQWWLAYAIALSQIPPGATEPDHT